jgi:ankyrin repeat protein
MLLEIGVSVDAKDALGRTAMHIACELGFPGVVEVLLRKDPDLELADDEGNTPVHICCENGHINILQLLIPHRYFFLLSLSLSLSLSMSSRKPDADRSFTGPTLTTATTRAAWRCTRYPPPRRRQFCVR